jgi:hypothetical protein
MNTKPDVVGEIKSLPIRARVAFALGMAETVVDELSEDPEGLAMARESLRRSWQWVSGAKVSASDVAEYLEATEERNLVLREALRESFYSKRPMMIKALYATTAAISHAAKKAYDLEGLRASEMVCDICDGVLDNVLKYVKDIPGYSEVAVHRLSGFLIEKYQGQSADALGDPPNQDEVLRQVAAAAH